MFLALTLLMTTLMTGPDIRALVLDADSFTLTHSGRTLLLNDQSISLPCTVTRDAGEVIFTDNCKGELRVELPLTLDPAPGGHWTVNEKAYRGSIDLYSHEEFSIRAVNSLKLEEYLRGVIPAEMGPLVYPELEALKAQAVAARSYAFVQLEKPLSVEYDICATPACQAYGGVKTEHPLSDRAISETEGLILVHDETPMATFYTATCGGHSTDGNHIFKNPTAEAYTGVPCFTLPSQDVEGRQITASPLTAAALTWSGDDIEGAMERYLGFASGTFCERVAHSLGLNDPSCASADLSGYLGHLDPFCAGSGGFHAASVAGKLLLRTKELTITRGIVKAVEKGSLSLLGEEETYSMEHPALFTRYGETCTPTDHLSLHPGDRVKIITSEKRVLALSVKAPSDPGSADGNAKRSRWVSFKSWQEISDSTGVENVSSLTPLIKSPEGRVLSLSVTGEEILLLEGLAVRFKLGIPEVWFTMIQGPEGVFFFGRGWGHGVGLCQEGAFGMAVAGHDFHQILLHYYPGFRVAHW